jgi:hypothetical protein
MNMPIWWWWWWDNLRNAAQHANEVGKRFNAQSNCSKERKVGPLYVKREREKILRRVKVTTNCAYIYGSATV